MRTEKQILKQIEDTEKQEETSFMDGKGTFYAAYRQALRWVLGD